MKATTNTILKYGGILKKDSMVESRKCGTIGRVRSVDSAEHITVDFPNGSSSTYVHHTRFKLIKDETFTTDDIKNLIVEYLCHTGSKHDIPHLINKFEYQFACMNIEATHFVMVGLLRELLQDNRIDIEIHRSLNPRLSRYFAC